MAWMKVTDKLYQLQIDGKYVDIHTPYGKTELIFKAFVGAGGIISEDGSVINDIPSMISNFKVVGNILLSTYGPRGEYVVEGDCTTLSNDEVIELFQVATDIVEAFIVCIGKMKPAAPVLEEKAAKQKKA